MICPKCKSKSRVYNSRPTDDGTIRRNRECLKCKHRYATIEVSADIKKVVGLSKPKVAKKKHQPRYTARLTNSEIRHLSDDELMDALEKGHIDPEQLG